MKWSWRVARISGIDVFVHSTFLILLAWVGLSNYLPERSLPAAAQGLTLVIALFSLVVLHELGHAFMARRFGIATRDITLLPIGGVARLERMPEEPRQELLVALAGPAVNAVLALGLALVLGLAGRLPPLQELSLVGGGLLPKLLWVNVALAVFNLLPAFPMDGGRVLRALLAMRMDFLDATQWAAHIGQGMALLFGFVGLLYNPFLIFIALFVWMGASAEVNVAQMRWALGGLPVSRVMIRDIRTLAPSDPLSSAVALVLSGFQQDFPVVRSGNVVGVLTQNRLFAALRQHGEQTPVEAVMASEFETTRPSEMMDTAFQRLQSSACRSLPVLENGKLAGLLTLDNLGEFLAIRTALERTA